MSTVGTRIREAREIRQLTQEDLAKILETSRTLVSSWEVDRTIPRGSSRLKIAQALRVNNEWLRSGIGPMDFGEVVDNLILMDRQTSIRVADTINKYIVPVLDFTKDVLRKRGVDLEEELLARVVIHVAIKCMEEKRDPLESDVTEILVRSIQGK